MTLAVASTHAAVATALTGVRHLSRQSIIHLPVGCATWVPPEDPHATVPGVEGRYSPHHCATAGAAGECCTSTNTNNLR